MHGEFSRESFERIFTAMTRDNPLIYFLNQSDCSIASDMFGHIAICPQYFFTKEKVKEYNWKIEKVVNELVEKVHLLECNDYQKELRVHDWLCQNVSYDYEGADKDKVSRVIASHNILGVFAHHKAQCEGFAKAVKVLLNAVDIKCIVATGETEANGKKEHHAWNIIDIDGSPYQVDVTWDIGASKGRIAYDYFNVTDKIISMTHSFEDENSEDNGSILNYGLGAFVEEKEFCPKCKNHMILAKNVRGTAYLKCSNKACKETKYLTVDLINWYINSHNVKCPKRDGGELKGGLGKYGPYIRCNCGHFLKPDEI